MSTLDNLLSVVACGFSEVVSELCASHAAVVAVSGSTLVVSSTWLPNPVTPEACTAEHQTSFVDSPPSQPTFGRPCGTPAHHH